MGKKTYYAPGVQNLSDTEIVHRRTIGNYGLIVTIITLAVLILSGATYILGLIIFIPAWVSAIGYLQARHKFCVFFAIRRTHSSHHGGVAKVTDGAEHEQDMMCATIMGVKAVMFGLLVTLATCGILYILT